MYCKKLNDTDLSKGVFSSQKIFLLRNPTVHHCHNNRSVLGHILSQFNPIHIFTTFFSKIHLNISLLYMLKTLQVTFLEVLQLKFRKNLFFSSDSIRFLFNHLDNIKWGVQLVAHCTETRSNKLATQPSIT